MSINRNYDDNGNLTSYTMSKEMKARAARYYKKTKRAQFIDAMMPYIIILAATATLVAWYLINN